MAPSSFVRDQRRSGLIGLILLAAIVPLPAAADTVVRDPVSFTVTNPMDPGRTFTITGDLIRPSAGCVGSVLLAMHGLSYGRWAWDFPIRPEDHSVAQAMAERGFALLAVDELGYGDSAGEGAPDHPNGYSLTVEGYADMTAQMIEQLRAGTYDAETPAPFAHVGLIGHSAGAEIVELTAALHPDLVELVIPTAYTHEPWVNNDWLVRSWIPDNVAAAQSDYVYFEGNPTQRASDMYNLANADADVVAWDTEHANLTPSGEVYSIGSQPSRFLLPTITMPVLLVLGENDELFPASFGDEEMAWFQAATDKTLLVAPDGGHVFMLERTASETNGKIADWLDARFPKC